MKTTRLFKSCLLGIGLVTGLSACVYDPYYAGPGPRVYHPYYYPHYYKYYYYPGVRVYYQLSTGFYFYYWDNRWRRSRVLPPHIHLHPRNRVIVRVEGDKPYVKHHEHVKKYHPRYKPHPLPRISKPQPPGSKPRYPDSRRQPPLSRPGKPVPRAEPPVSRKERARNKQIYKKHQKQQQEFEKEWKKRHKKDDRR